MKIIDANTGESVIVGGTLENINGVYRIEELRITPNDFFLTMFIVKDKPVLPDRDRTGTRITLPLTYRNNHPSFPNEEVLFIPS